MEEIVVAIARVVKSKKSNKTIITYIKPEADTEYVKGGLELVNFYDNTEIIDRVTHEDLLKPLRGKYTWEAGYNGTAKMKVVELYNANGINILA